jgi:hypothetical protein
MTSPRGSRSATPLQLGDIRTQADADQALQALSIGDALGVIADRIFLPPALIPLALLESHLATGPVPWHRFSGFNVGGRAEDLVHAAMARTLGNATRPEVADVLFIAGTWLAAGRVQLIDPVGRLMLAYARGTQSGQREHQRRLAAHSVSCGIAAPVDVLVTACQTASDLERVHDLMEVGRAIEHLNATEAVWAAAAASVWGPQVLTRLAKIPAACRVEAVWRHAIADMEQVRPGRSLDAQGTLRWDTHWADAAWADQLARILRSTDEAGLGPVLAALISVNESRAVAVLGTIGQKRLRAVDPAVLVPLLTSASATVRAAMVSLLATVGPDAVTPLRRRRSR